MGRFDGKVVLVTGGNRNTGLDIVEKFAREGAKVLTIEIWARHDGVAECYGVRPHGERGFSV